MRLPCASGLMLLATMAGAETPARPVLPVLPVLTVLTYDSFLSEWGPGPAIERAFEAQCGCDLRLEGAGDGAALLARLQLEGSDSPADVVVGLDTALAARAAATGLFAPHGQAPMPDLPVPWEDPLLLPYDWGWFAFVYEAARLPHPPASLEELAASPVRVVIEDPRSSTPGLGLLLWVEAAYGPRAGEIWRALADNIVTVTPGWSEAYGLFLEGEAEMVLSYTTSPLYHLIAEGDAGKAAAPFAEGHYLQIELAGVLKASRQPDLARRFLAFLGSDPVQAVLPTTNWMYPARMPATGLPEGFDRAIRPERSLLLSPAEAEARRGPATATWRAALSR